MATFKEKYGGQKGVFMWLKYKVSQVKKPLGCNFQITGNELVGELLTMKVSLQDFLDFLKPISVEVEPGLNEDFPNHHPPQAAYPEAFYCESLKLRWGILFSEQNDRWLYNPETEKQFKVGNENYAAEFESLVFTFEDKELLEEFLKAKVKTLTQDPNKIYRDKPNLLAYKNKTHHLKKTKIPFYLVRLAWENQGIVSVKDLIAVSGENREKCFESALNFKEDISKKFEIKPPARLLNPSESDDVITLLPEFFAFPNKP